MEFNLVDILQHVLNIVVLYIILRALVYKPVREYMKKRQENLDKQRLEISEGQSEVMDLKAKYEQSLSGAKAEAEGKVREGVLRADIAAKEIIEKSEKDARAILAEAKEQAALEQARLEGTLKSEVADLALELASKILEREVSAADNRAVIEQFFKGLSKVNRA
ncbi:MAG: ATP synthase F0 subunit B [Christensenellales bacterium]|jgi:F-type H+-transporting ATPase subunit b